MCQFLLIIRSFLRNTNPVPYIKQVASFGQSQNVTGGMLAMTANHDNSCFKHITE